MQSAFEVVEIEISLSTLSASSGHKRSNNDGFYLRQYDNFRSQRIECRLWNVNIVNYNAAAHCFDNSKQRQRHRTFSRSSAPNYSDLVTPQQFSIYNTQSHCFNINAVMNMLL